MFEEGFFFFCLFACFFFSLPAADTHKCSCDISADAVSLQLKVDQNTHVSAPHQYYFMFYPTEENIPAHSEGLKPTNLGRDT